MIKTTQIINRQVLLGEPIVNVYGSSEDNTRTMQVTIEVFDLDKNRVDTINKTYTGDDYAPAYANYDTDKDLMAYVLTGTQYSHADLSTMADILENVL